MLNNIIECPICFNEINNEDGIIIPECCNNAVHLKCILNWYSTNNKNNICFICQQENQFVKNIHSNNNERKNEANNNLLEYVRQENISENNYDENNNVCIKVCLACSFLGTLLSFLLITLV